MRRREFIAGLGGRGRLDVVKNGVGPGRPFDGRGDGCKSPYSRR
jgi:hypothetical protein